MLTMIHTGNSKITRGVERKLLLVTAALTVANLPLFIALLAPSLGRAESQVSTLRKEPLRFEVAALKPNNSGGPAATVIAPPGPGGQFRMTNVPLREFVRQAFGVQDRALIAPDWLKDRSFDLTAKIPSGRRVNKADLEEMLRTLLLERGR
jgi:hypothetical protein